MNVFRSKKFEKSLKKVLSGGKVRLNEVEKTIKMLADGQKVLVKYKDHPLKGEWKGYRECNIRPDVLLIYQKHEDKLILVLIDIGSHSELFS